MATIQDGWTYSSDGKLFNAGGTLLFEFNAELNPDLHAALTAIGSLVGKTVTGDENEITIDGTPYTVIHEEDTRQELVDAVQGLADELGITTVKAKAIMKHIYKVIKAARYWG
jgi:hypothetical protein